MSVIYKRGTVEVTVPNAQKIAVLSQDPCVISYQVGYPNYPSVWKVLAATEAGVEYLSAAFTGATNVRVEAGAADAFYEVGTAPVTSEPLADQSWSDATGILQGLAAAQGGVSEIKGGTSSTTGNAGGAAKVTGGQPGATGVGGAAVIAGGIGGATSGKGGAATVTGGAGTNGDGPGGSVILTGGAKNGSGLDGGVMQRSGLGYFKKQSAITSKADGNETVTAAQLIGGICVFTVTTGRTMTTPTGAAILAGCPTDIAAGDAFEFTLITLGAGGDDIATMTAGDGDVTFVGDVTVGPAAASTTSSGTFRFRYTGANAFVGYRL